jgi:AraC-like DNA-binding protein
MSRAPRLFAYTWWGTIGTGPAHNWRVMPSARRLLRAKDLADARYFEPLTVADLARVAGLSPAHFSREFRRAFGEAPHEYLLTRRLERAGALLRNTDRTVTDICFDVGLTSVGSFTSSFRRVYGTAPSTYRVSFPPARRHIRVPDCVARAYGRPQNRTFREARAPSSVVALRADDEKKENR